MSQFNFNPKASAPLVRCVIVGPKGAFRVRLVLDSGSYNTQITRGAMNALGFQEGDKVRDAYSVGVGGARENGIEVIVPRLFVLGKRFEKLPVCVFEMKYIEKDGTDGLIGWDLIQLLHFEMNGPQGILKIF